MNRTDFIQIIREQKVTDRETISEVRELVVMFPWFQSAHLIILKALHDTGDVKFGTQLRQSALHVADRAVLYYLLNGKPAVTGENTDTTSTKSVKEEAAVPDQEQVVIEVGRNSQEMISGIEKEKALLTAGTASDINHTEYFLEVTAESETDESASVMLVIDSDEEHSEETIIYMDPSISLPDTETDLLELDENEKEEEIVINKTSDDSGTAGEGGVRKMRQAELIDRFIETNPRIEPVRAKTDHQQEDIAAKFTEERGELVTETLAKIYVTQGYYSRAIEIYEKLSLKFPEKSSYFATRIEKIKELIK